MLRGTEASEEVLSPRWALQSSPGDEVRDVDELEE